jgi:hypothetical protein
VTDDRPPSLDRLIEANRALKALYAVEKAEDRKGRAAAVMNGKVAYQRLYARQHDDQLTRGQATLIRTALELLRTKLKAFGHAV